MTTPVFLTDMLRDILIQCQKFEVSKVFTAFYLMAFFSFLQLSNIIPYAFNGFDLSKHLARGDLFGGILWLSLS